MAFVTKDRVLETSTTTGTGTYTLAGASTGFQTFLGGVVSANDYVPYYAEDGTNWECGIGRVLSSPSRLERTTVLKSSNSNNAVNWGAGTRNLRCGWPAELNTPRVKSKSVAGSSDVTLTQDEQRADVLILTGALTGNISVIVDATPWRWIVFNNTSGAYTLTVKVSGQPGVAVTQAKSKVLYCDGTDVEDGATDAPTSALPRSYLAGCTLSNNGSDATNDIDIAAGACRDSTNAANITVAAMTKSLDANWAAGTNQGMRYSGAAIANTTYGIWAAAKADGTQDIYAYPNSGAPSAATVLAALQAETGGADYLYVRRIGCILRESAAIVAFSQMGDEFLRSASVLDVNASNPGTSAVTRTLSVPLGVKVHALLRAGVLNAASGVTSAPLLSEMDRADEAPSSTAAPLLDTGGLAAAAGWQSYEYNAMRIRTNTSAQVRSRLLASDANCTLRIATYGWIDARGRDD